MVQKLDRVDVTDRSGGIGVGSGGPMIVTQHSTEPFMAVNLTAHRVESVIRLDQNVVESLVVALAMVMSSVLASRLLKRPFSEEDHPMETFVLDLPRLNDHRHLQIVAN
jgi:hypothetical protein